MSTARQLALGFEHRPALAGEDFLVTPTNAEAVAWLDRWPDWPAPALVIHGPPGCGKTHLGQVFLARSGGRVVVPADLAGETAPADLAAAPALLLDGIEDFLQGGLDEALLHLYNSLAEAGRHALLTAARGPVGWPIGLPDLASRLRALPGATVAPPDDALIAALLVKLFADRQLRVEAEVIAFLQARVERSFAAAREVVAAIDAAALAARRKITIPLVREVLARHWETTEGD